MLRSIPWKLSPLLTILTLSMTLACGKKIGESSSSEPATSTENQVPNSLVILPLQSHALTYPFDKFGSFTTPSELVVKEGNSAGKTISIYYNLDMNGLWSIKCTYKGNSAGNQMNLSRCVDTEGDLGPVSNLLTMIIYVYPGHFIQMQNPSGNLKVDALYQVKW